MIPITLVTGFLGSGKTSFLEHLIATGEEQNIVYLVNEFSPRDVDGARIELPENKLITISGGSIFCRCKVTEFISGLRRLQTLTPLPDAVVIEASGISDPSVMSKMLSETELDTAFEVVNIVCLIDIGSFPKLLPTLGNVTSQVESANLILLNKTDIHSKDEIANVYSLLETLQINAPVVETTYGRASVNLLTKNTIPPVDGEYAKCVNPNFAQIHLPLDATVNWQEVRNKIDQLPYKLYRVKGFVPTEDGCLYVDFASNRWSERKAEDTNKAGLVFIFSVQDSVLAKRLTEIFALKI